MQASMEYTLNGREITDDLFGGLVREIEDTVSLVDRTSIRRTPGYYQREALHLALYYWSIDEGNDSSLRNWVQVLDAATLQNFRERFSGGGAVRLGPWFRTQADALYERAVRAVRRGD